MTDGHPHKNATHLRFIRQLPCVICAFQPSEAAHVRYASSAYAKDDAGVGRKPADCWVVPLCWRCHRESNGAQHRIGEAAFWSRHQIDPLRLAERLWAASPDTEKGAAIARQARRVAPNLET